MAAQLADNLSGTQEIKRFQRGWNSFCAAAEHLCCYMQLAGDSGAVCIVSAAEVHAPIGPNAAAAATEEEEDLLSFDEVTYIKTSDCRSPRTFHTHQKTVP